MGALASAVQVFAPSGQQTPTHPRVIRSLKVHIRTTLVDQMRAIILSEVEFVALLGLSLWSPRMHRGCEKAERIANNYRAQIFYGLHEHYRDERKMDNYANRLGDIMCLFVDAQVICQKTCRGNGTKSLFLVDTFRAIR
ncbi:hypothetical protein COOONC_23302 [Cooperia oncophora]